MKIFPLLLSLLLISAIVLPVGAEDVNYDDLLKKTRNLNVTVPEKGTALLGTKNSMTDYLDWLNASAYAMITFVDDVLDAFGLSNTSYAQDLTKILKSGFTPSPSRTG
ncbi:MAG: hypothetical protein ACYDDV_08400 [Methanoregula sp.]